MKRKHFILAVLSLFALNVSVFSALTNEANAQGATQTVRFVNKTGTVYSANPGRATFKATTDKVIIKLTKTGGKAETQVNIYVNNRFSKKMEFDNGNYSGRSYTRTLTGVKNKTIKVEIVNQSVANTFKYSLVCTGEKPAVPNCPKVVLNKTGKVYSVRPGTHTVRPTCNNLEIKLQKTGGRAETQANVYINGRFQQSAKMEFDNGPAKPSRTKLLRGVRGKTVKIEIVNQSVGNTFDYRLTCTQKN